MQFSCESKELAQSVNIVKRAISSSNNAPIFSGIHAILQGNTLQLIAMDNTYMMNKKMDVNGQEDGELLIPAKAIGICWPVSIRTKCSPFSSCPVKKK